MPLKQTFGSRAQVMHGTANKTTGGLTKSQLKYNKQGKIVSKKASALAKKNNRLVKAGYVTKKGKFGVEMRGGARGEGRISTAIGIKKLLKDKEVDLDQIKLENNEDVQKSYKKILAVEALEGLIKDGKLWIRWNWNEIHSSKREQRVLRYRETIDFMKNKMEKLNEVRNILFSPPEYITFRKYNYTLADKFEHINLPDKIII